MNNVTIQWRFVDAFKVSGNELMMLSLIYCFSKERGTYFYRSITELMHLLGISRKSVFNVMAKLLEKGLIYKERWVKVNGGKFSYSVTDKVRELMDK